MIIFSKNDLSVTLTRFLTDNTENFPKPQVVCAPFISGSETKSKSTQNWGFNEIKDTDKLLFDALYTTYKAEPIIVLDYYRYKRYTCLITDYNWEVSYSRLEPVENSDPIEHEYYHLNLEVLILDEFDLVQGSSPDPDFLGR